MQTIDWILLVLPIAFVIAIAVYTRRFMKSVADFMAGGRAAGRYLICNAKGEASSGVANTLSKFQPLIVSGFVLSWWDVSVPVSMFFAIFGFVVYRYRQTRAMTLGQFFEMRYSRRFRLFAGIMGFMAGLLNYGIFPAVSSDFFIYFLNLPHSVDFGLFHITTKALIMASYLSCALGMMMVGGQVTSLMTHCVEGIMSHLILVIVALVVLWLVGWTQIRGVLEAAPAGHSMLNPFDQAKTKDFNFWFAMITVFMVVYGTMTAQKDNSFSSAGRTAHETRMGGVLGWWRIMARAAVLTVIALGALTALKQPGFAGKAQLDAITDPQLNSQMQVPMALRYMLPAGVKGLFLTLMVMGLLSGDAAHMLTWGGIFVQDVVLPLRKTAMSPKQHVFILRMALVGVALFAFIFSLFFHQTQYIAMWWAITEGIFACGAAICIIGGLYWKKGTTTGACSAFVTGSVLSVTGIILPYWIKPFPLNGKHVQFIAALSAITVYLVVSLLTSKKDFDLDRLLHRGKYAIKSDATPETAKKKHRFEFGRLLGFDADFTFWDKIVAGGIFFWSAIWLGIVIVGSIWNLFDPWSLHTWSSYWFVMGIVVPMILCIGTLFWFTIGGFVDIRAFFALLRSHKRDASDDGSVTEPHPTGPGDIDEKSKVLSYQRPVR